MNLSEMEDWEFSRTWSEMPVEEKTKLPPDDSRHYAERYRTLTAYMTREARRHKKGNGEGEDAGIDPEYMETKKPTGAQFVDAADFISNITPPQWLVDGIIQRSFLYGLTAQTNHGKTALAAHIAVCVALGRPFGNQPCEPGHVLFMAGENPEDFKLRLRGACQANGIKPDDIRGKITVLAGANKLVTFIEQVQAFSKSTPLALVEIDTSAAYFSYKEENDNNDSLMHAQDMRMLISAQGNPAVLALCHPVKNAGKELLVPRGGGAFLFELDCNLTLWKEGEIMELHHNKLRGPPFQPLSFKLDSCVLTGLLDSKGRSVATVVTSPIDESQAQSEQDQAYSDADIAILAIHKLPKPSISNIASFCQWKFRDGRPDKSKAQRIIKMLIEEKCVNKSLGRLSLTPKGRKQLPA